MSRGICPRVNSCGSFWVLSAVVFALNAIDVDAYSCHEVRTAFQLRQVGPLHRVPETPGTGERVGLAFPTGTTAAKTHCISSQVFRSHTFSSETKVINVCAFLKLDDDPYVC